MTSIILDDNKLKEALKQAIRELIQEDQAMISNLIAEVIEDIALENTPFEAATFFNPQRETEKSSKLTGKLLKLNVTLKKPSQEQVEQALDEFNQAVEQFLEETDITQEELAEALDLSQPLK